MSSSKLKHLKPGAKVPLSLALEQVELIAEKPFISGELLAILYAAKVRDRVVVARYTLAQLNRLAQYIDSEARDTTSVQLQNQLVAISRIIRTLEGGYCDGSSVQPRTIGLRQQEASSNVVSIRSRVKVGV
ncbi:MAG: hypothetical protein IPI02_12110 [Sterolibacteriaceae bacterium]|nr:hypothetical protein [Sterolibacteriaceae bacterium]